MKKKNDKRERILNAAVRIFAKRGFYNTKVAEIAKQAGVADGTIYLYFKNKDEILISIFEEEMERIIAEMRAELSTASDHIQKLRIFMSRHLQFVKRKPNLAHVFQLELRQSNRFIKEYTGSRLKEYLGIIGGLIEEGQARGLFKANLHPGLVKRALFGALDEIATHWVLSKNGKYDLVESAEQVATIFLQGILVAGQNAG